MKKMKKYVFALMAFTIFGFSTFIINAAMLMQYTPNTYVNNIHEGFWSDTYQGVTAIKGSDWISSGGFFKYPTFSRITYNVQGSITVGEIKSQGPNDAVARKKTTTVKDKWNDGPKTTAKWNIGLVTRDTDLRPYSVNLKFDE